MMALTIADMEPGELYVLRVDDETMVVVACELIGHGPKHTGEVPF